MKDKKVSTDSNGFTLIEMLVTISIIAILAALLIPTISKTIDKGDRTQAQGDVQAIFMAINAYQNEYNALPNGDSKTIIRTLLGGESSGENKRKIPFLTAKGRDDSGKFEDPWGNQYEIDVDNDYDGYVNGIRVPAVVKSLGPDEVESKDDIVSYEK